MASLCYGELILDIGFTSRPNTFLNGKVIGVDIATCVCPSNYWCTVVASAEALPFCNCFDSICAGEIIEHVRNPVKLLVECNRALKIRGRLVLSTPNPYHLAEILKHALGKTEDIYANTHYYLFPYRLILKLLDLTGFRFIRCFGDYLKIPGLPLTIPTERFPRFSNGIIYLSKKYESVGSEEIYPKLLEKVESFYRDYKHRYGKSPSWY